MNQPGYLIDENLTVTIALQLRRHAPYLSVLAIKEAGAPPKGMLDPEILIWLETNNYRLVTNNRTSMPNHLSDHLAAGRHIPGILVIANPLNIGELIQELILIWQISFPDEYRDQIIYLPVSR